MDILILGGDGYLGWPTAMYLAAKGHNVAVVDNMSKRVWEAECSVEPLFPISTISSRVNRFEEMTGLVWRIFSCLEFGVLCSIEKISSLC